MSRRRDEIKWLTGALSRSSGIVGTSCTATEITLSESHENEISVWRASADLNSLVKMGERLKAALRGYLKYRLIMRIIWAFVGVVVGIAGCIVFAKVYHNYNAAIWAGVSALFAVVFLHLHFAVRRDIERIIPRSKFTVIMYIGLTGLIAGVVGFVTNLALGIHRHETGIHTDRNYIVCVWNFMTFKWGLFSFLAARKFRMLYFEMDPQSRGLVQEA